MFDHQSGKVTSQILTLLQGSSSVAYFSIRLHILMARSGWNNAALQGVFIQGLAVELKDELAAREESEDLEMLISLVIQLDNRLRERRQQRNSKRPGKILGSLSWRSGAPVELSTPVPTPPQEDVEPMQLGRTRLSHMERKC